MKIWSIDDKWQIKRHSRIVATMAQQPDGRLMWHGMNMVRINFKTEESVLDDVKYFYRRGGSKTILTFASGHQVVL